jgi:hypothetical protein
MTRREFSATIAGCAVAFSFGPGKPCESLLELRIYRGAGPGLAKHLAAVFPRAGIRPLLQATAGPDLAYLIPFQNLSARHRAWTELNADPEWTRARPRFQSYHFGLYRAS